MKEQIEKQAIEEMAKVMHEKNREIAQDCCGIEKLIAAGKSLPDAYAEALYNEGYRKQSAVIDEFAKRLKEKMNDLSRMEYNCVPYSLVSKSFIDKIAAEMKGGAE